MRYGVHRGLTLVTLGALLVCMFCLPAPSRAQVGITTPPLTGTTTTALADTGTLAAGASDALQASALTGSIPQVVSVDILHATTIGYPNQMDSEAAVSDLSLTAAGTSIGVGFAMARVSEVFGSAGATRAEVDNLSIDGIPVVVTGAPGQTIALPGGAAILINERRTLPDGTIVVNALHITVPGVEDVVVASSMAGASGGRGVAVQASY